MKRLNLVTGLVALFFVFPTPAWADMSKKTEIQIMKRACQMVDQGYTTGEIWQETVRLVTLNNPSTQQKFSDPYAPKTVVTDIARGLDDLMAQHESLSNKLYAERLLKKAGAKNCKF
jgi:hypothetical protein